MPRRLFSWLGSRSASTADEPALPVARPVSPVPGPAPSPAGEPAAPSEAATPSLEARELRSHLDAEIAAELRAMRASLQPVDRNGDAGELLRSLDGDPADAIRRPPLAAQQALAACRDPNASLDAILATVHQDPALSQSLLRHANSPFYATGGGAVSSLRDAASRVGLSGLHGVLIGSMVEGMLCRPGGEFGPMAQQVWQHMVRTAPIARRVGRALRLPPETCYTLGLLHDLGKLIVFDRLTAMRTANRQSVRIRYPVLKDLLGKLHGALGGVAALKWNLDVEGARAIASHPRGAYRTYQDEWYGELGFTLGESAGETMSQVLAVAEWWDITGLRHQARDFDAFWAKGGLTIDLETCQETLEEA
ncbi:MAG: HDOD domain-containing protein [Gemmatimonadales bacterium]